MELSGTFFITPLPPAICTLLPIFRCPDIPAGISGHLKIGSNVQIAGGSGVIKNVPDNSKIMGYPAKNIKNFLRDNK